MRVFVKNDMIVPARKDQEGFDISIDEFDKIHYSNKEYNLLLNKIKEYQNAIQTKSS